MKKRLNICRWWININCMFVVFLVLLVPKDIQSLVLWVYVLSVSSLNLYIKAMIEKLPSKDGDSKPLEEEGSKQGQELGIAKSILSHSIEQKRKI